MKIHLELHLMSSLCLLSVDDVYEQRWLAAECLMMHKIKPRLSAALWLPSGTHTAEACWEYKLQTAIRWKELTSLFLSACTQSWAAFFTSYSMQRNHAPSVCSNVCPISSPFFNRCCHHLFSPSAPFFIHRPSYLPSFLLSFFFSLSLLRTAVLPRQSMTKTLSFCC